MLVCLLVVLLVTHMRHPTRMHGLTGRVTAIAVIFAVASVSIASLTANANTIYACVNRSTGVVRIVSRSTACDPSEYATRWNVTGSPDPQGPMGPQGVALPLAGWYLVEPPLGQQGPDPSLSHWTHPYTFDSARDCESALAAARVDEALGIAATELRHALNEQRPSMETVKWKCIATDDPRLKGN
jgi:hypothetical protein